jgi:NitT/TauT family transport system substrate-binding protein
MLSRRQMLATIAATATTPIGVAGCASRPRRAAAHGVDRVTYLTGFGSFGREGYAWVADAKGYFHDAGIEVTIRPGAAGASNLRLLAAGQAQFAVIDYSGAVVQVGTGHDTAFRAVAAINQQTMIALMALRPGAISHPADLVGRTVAQAAGAVPKTLFPAYARLAGFDARKVRWRESTPQALPALLATGKVDAIGQFVAGEPSVRAAVGGRGIVVLPYSDFMTDLYGNVLVTSADLVARNPDLVSRFATALLRGLKYSIDNPEQAAAMLHSAVPGTDPAVAADEVRLMRAYVGAPLGVFNPGRVARGIATIQGLGLIPAGYDPAQLVDFAAVPSPVNS